MNWPFLTSMVMLGYEQELAAEEGFPDNDELVDRAALVRDTVLDAIGEARFITAFIDADFDVRPAFADADADADAFTDAVLEQALRVSGYTSARQRLFPQE